MSKKENIISKQQQADFNERIKKFNEKGTGAPGEEMGGVGSWNLDANATQGAINDMNAQKTATAIYIRKQVPENEKNYMNIQQTATALYIPLKIIDRQLVKTGDKKGRVNLGKDTAGKEFLIIVVRS